MLGKSPLPRPFMLLTRNPNGTLLGPYLCPLITRLAGDLIILAQWLLLKTASTLPQPARAYADYLCPECFELDLQLTASVFYQDGDAGFNRG